MLAAAGSGVHEDLPAAARAMDSETTSFEPKMSQAERERRLAGWHDALGRV
jgi:glycerol kinase